MPNDNYTDIHIDGNSQVPSMVSCSMPTATTYEYGALEVDVEDTLNMTKSVKGNAESKFLSLLNNGTINIKAHANDNTQSTGLSFCEEVVNNGMINLNGSSARNRTTAKLNFESNFVNKGKIAIVQIAGDRNNVNFNIKGGVKGENNGEIVVSLEGTRNDGSNYARMLIDIPVVNVAHYTLGGNGVIELLENERSNNLNGMPVLSGSSAQMIVTNGINHTIMGSGNVDKFSLVNEGLVIATGDNLRLSVQHTYRDANGQTMINTVNGRMVAVGAAGLYLGASTDKNSQFFNYGLLEARHGSFIEFRKGATESNSKSKISTSVAAKWGGRWAGSGEFRMFRPLALTQQSVIAPGDLATAVDGAGNVIYGTGESTCGTLTFTNSLTMNSGTISEFQFKRADSFDSLHVGGTLKVDGTLKVVGRPHGGTYRMITSDCPITSDNEKFFSAFDMSEADGVRRPRLSSGSEEYDVEVTSTTTDPESGEVITETETVTRTRYYIDASFPDTFSIVIR